MSIRDRIYERKGTIVRLTFHCKSGNNFKYNPLQDCSSGFVRGIEPDNKYLKFHSSLPAFHDNAIVFIDDKGRQTSVLHLELKESIIGISSLVLYPDGSTWEGLIGSDIPSVKAMVWSPALAPLLGPSVAAVPWDDQDDWKSVPTAFLIFSDEVLAGCPRIEHTCCEPCK